MEYNDIELIDESSTKFANWRGEITLGVTAVKSFEEAIAWFRKSHPAQNPKVCYKYGVNYYFLKEDE